MGPVGELLDLRSAFESEEEYLEFCNRLVIPCLCSLTVAVGKDQLWKPLNHRVLLLSRSNRIATRMLAIRTLHSLFREVRLLIPV